MEGLPVRVGLLQGTTPSEEQRAAADWCAGIANGTDRLHPDSVAAGDSELDHDVLWWHRVRSLEAAEFDLEALGSIVRRYLDAGGGLLLTLRALSAVSAFGIDPIDPDTVAADVERGEAGYLTKSLHSDHPVFETFHKQRLPLAAPETTGPCTRYESVLPARGDVLACTYRDDDPIYERKPMIEWRMGAGNVIGAGSHVWFAKGGPHTGARRRLIQNALALLGRSHRSTPWGRPEDSAEFRTLRAALSEDHHRPRYHLSPPANWLNDPNGVIRWNGQYHVFYQYNPAGPFHDTIHWGHAVSDDLIHWRDEPVALAPDPDGPDRDGCWSGCAVDDDGTPTLIYTGGRDRRQLPCVATSGDPDLRDWTKGANPVIESPPPDLDVFGDYWEAEFRDHCVWREDGRWWHLIGSGVTDGGGAALLYFADDLRDWRYAGPLLLGDPDRSPVWECPELLRFPGTDNRLLHVSEDDRVTYWIGTAELDERRPGFTPHTRGTLDHGDFYAPQSMWDGEQDRYLMWGWLPEARSVEAQWDAGWSGLLSLPRVVDIVDGSLHQRPASELRRLREEQPLDRLVTFEEGGSCRVVDGTGLELTAEIRLDTADEAGLVVRESPAAGERTVIRFTGDALVVDRAASSLDPHTDPSEQRMPVEDESISLHGFVDGSVLELFVNERRCLTSRIYPTRADATGVSAYADGAAALDLAAWRLGSIWPTPSGR